MRRRIVIFGATGGTGRELARQAVEAKYSVTAFVRSPDKLGMVNSNVEVMRGDVLSLNDVRGAVENQDIVLCSIGAPANDRSMVRARGTANIITAMAEHGVDRLICQSSLGVGDSRALLPWVMKYLIVPLILNKSFEDHEKQESLVESSELAWTIVRPAGLTDGPATGQYKHGFGPSEKVTGKVSRADTARFMLRQLEDKAYLHHKVGLSY